MAQKLEGGKIDLMTRSDKLSRSLINIVSDIYFNMSATTMEKKESIK